MRTRERRVDAKNDAPGGQTTGCGHGVLRDGFLGQRWRRRARSSAAGADRG